MGNGFSEETIERIINAMDSYSHIHVYLAVFVCTFGVITNTLNIIVLTRKNMKSSTNLMLIILAVSDGLLNVIYIPYAILDYARISKFAEFYYAFAILSYVLHTVSVWITVTLSIFRYIAIRFPFHQKRYCSMKRTKITVTVVILLCMCISIPNALSYEFLVVKHNGETLRLLHFNDHTIFGTKLMAISFWIMAIMVNFLPSLLLSVFSLLLIKTMKSSNKRRHELCNTVYRISNNTGRSHQSHSRIDKGTETTKLILTIVVLFVLTTLPQGILNLTAGISKTIFDGLIVHFGSLMDILTLVNSAVNFIIYCTMSMTFRTTFSQVFCSKCK